MLTDYEIQKISVAIVENLVDNDKFIKRIAKAMQKDSKKLIGSTQAAKLPGVTRKTVCEIAPYIGGIRGKGESAHWMFHEDGLVDRYLRYKGC
jgi:hypothetical protein